jgi:hypothetical protein
MPILVPPPTLLEELWDFMDTFIMPGTLELSMTAFVITDLKVKILLGEEIWFWVTE